MSDAKNTLNNKKVALYIRVSTLYQIDKDSLPMQRDDLINYAKYVLGIDSYEIFEDAGYSAKNTDRPAYQQMMSRLRTGEFSHLLVWKIDRISRNLLDFASMYSEMKALGITFVSKNEQFDTSTAIGEAMLKIILVFAELERNMTSERVTAVMLSRASNGLWNGGRIPYGYDYDKETHSFSINEAEKNVIHIMYEQYEINKSLLYVSRYLNGKGIKTRNGRVWSPTTVNKILTSPFYIGHYYYNLHDVTSFGSSYSPNKKLKPEKEWVIVENHHPAIVDIEQWSRVRATLADNQRSNKGKKTYCRKNTHIFAGLLQCGVCGSTMPSTLDRVRANGYRPSIYICSRHRRFNDCPNKYISDITVGPFVFNYISNVMRAQNNFGKSTSLETFEKKLLRGNVFSNVYQIEREGLNETYQILRSGKSYYDIYNPTGLNDGDTTIGERDLLATEIKKHQRGLARLKSLYLYGDDALSEKDYIVEQKRLLDNIEKAKNRIDEIDRNSSPQFSISDEEFIAKASYFHMSQVLLSKRYINFESLVLSTDPKLLKDFVNFVIKKIVILNGKITEIQFKNGITHKFLYSE